MTTIYCEATHPKSPEGCFSAPNHDGPHQGWSSVETSAERVEWEDDPETFTDEELAILITALQPVKHFFPGLEAKLHRARAGVQ